jgi:hypothetical protein
MNFLKNLFGRKAVEEIVEDYDGYRIFPTPMPAGSKFRLSARIELDVDGETLVHHLIRADTLDDADHASSVAILKAKQVIDQQGKGMFR